MTEWVRRRWERFVGDRLSDHNDRFDVELASELIDVDAARDIDIDLAIVDEGMFVAAGTRGVRLRSNGTRTGRLTAMELDVLGLRELKAELTEIARHEVNFMIFPDERSAKRRGLKTLTRGSA